MWYEAGLVIGRAKVLAATLPDQLDNSSQLRQCPSRQWLVQKAGKSWSRFVVDQAANGADVALAWCGPVLWHRWQAVLHCFEQIGPSVEGCQTHQTKVNYNSPGELIRTTELIMSWQLLMTVTGLLDVAVAGGSTQKWITIVQVNWYEPLN